MAVRMLATLLACLSLWLGLASCSSCDKDTVTPQTPSATPVPEAAKTQIPADRLMGLSLNGQSPETLAKQSGDPSVLEAADLGQYFQLFQNDYLESVLKLAQSQMDSGKPLQGIVLYFGSAPKKLAVKCVADLSPDTCLVEPAAFDCNEALPKKSWSDEIYPKICQSIGRVKVLQSRTLVAAFDGDNTTWFNDLGDNAVKRGVESGKINWGEGKADLMAIYPTGAERKDYKLSHTPLQYYDALYELAGPLFNYQFGALAFRGLSLNEANAVFKDTLSQETHPTAFPEMLDLLKFLQSQGVITGIVSASPNFLVYPMVESLQAGIPLENAEGLDVLLRNPADAATPPVRLSRLLAQGKWNESSQLAERFQTYDEFLSSYGSWVIADVDPILNARAGKAVGLRSIARRVVAKNNLNPGGPGNLLDIDSLRILLVAGDNFAPASDLPNPKGDRKQTALEAGNDQGMCEAISFLAKSNDSFGGSDLLYIRRFTLESDKQAYPKKDGLARFQALLDQQRLLRPDHLGAGLVQPAITDVKQEGGKGGFLTETPKTPETQPTESLPESMPGATPPPTVKPTGKPFGPLPADNLETPELIAPLTPTTPGTTVTPAVTPKPAPVPTPKPALKLDPLPPAPPSSDAL